MPCNHWPQPWDIVASFLKFWTRPTIQCPLFTELGVGDLSYGECSSRRTSILLLHHCHQQTSNSDAASEPSAKRRLTAMLIPRIWKAPKNHQNNSSALAVSIKQPNHHHLWLFTAAAFIWALVLCSCELYSSPESIVTEDLSWYHVKQTRLALSQVICFLEMLL